MATGRPKSWVWEHFDTNKINYKTNNSYYNAWCIAELKLEADILRESDKDAAREDVTYKQRSQEQLWAQGTCKLIYKHIINCINIPMTHAARENVAPMCGKAQTMLSHLVRCDSVREEVKRKAEDEKAIKKDGNRQTSTPTPGVSLGISSCPGGSGGSVVVCGGAFSKRQKIESVQQNFTVVGSKRWTPGRQHDFNRDLCDLFVSCGIAWNAASNPQLALFCNKWIPGADIPDRQFLSGQVLKERVADVEGNIKREVAGKMGMGQCDGWKNISKVPLVASMITVEYQVRLFNRVCVCARALTHI